MLKTLKPNGRIRFSLPRYLRGILIGIFICAALVVIVEMSVTPKGEKPVQAIIEVGHIANPRITESSGVAASQQHPGIFWTHNDGGGPKRQVLYGIDREGKSLAEFNVVGAEIVDWEDIALDNTGHLYIADTGDNYADREEIAVYEIDEPDPKSSNTAVNISRSWKLHFPKQPFDCEALFVWKSNGYVVSKVLNKKKAEIFRFSLADNKDPITLDKVARLPIESPVTGADISSDGRRLAIVCHAGAYIFEIDGKVGKADNAPYRRAKFRNDYIEGCCFVPEGLLATAESREILLFNEAAFE
jgi:hypothetical protein